MAIKYEAYTRLGEKVKGVLQTDSEDDAYTILEREELVPYRLRPVRPRPTAVQLAPWLFKPKIQEVIDFTRQLASLLNSGITFRRALLVLREQVNSIGLKEALRRILQDVESGERFSDAFARHPTVFPEFYLRLLRVGESTGGIAVSLEQLNDNLQRRKMVVDKVRKALIYPGISLTVAFVAAFVLIRFTLPAMTALLTEFGGELPAATRLLIKVSDFVTLYGNYMIGVFVGLVVLAILGGRFSWTKRMQDRVILSAPVEGKVITGSNLFFLTTTLSTLLRAGVPPIEALRLTETGLGNTKMKQWLRNVTARAEEGTKLGEAFSEEQRFPPILAQAIITGEMRGSIVDTLGSLSDYYEDVTDSSLSSATELIQPAVILILAGLVGFVAVAVMTGIYSTLEQVG